MKELCKQIQPKSLQDVFISCHAEIFGKSKMPNYNKLSREIDEAISEFTGGEPAHFRYLLPEEIKRAQANPLPKIEKIHGPMERTVTGAKRVNNQQHSQHSHPGHSHPHAA